MAEYIERDKLPVKQISIGGPMMPRFINVVYADDIAAAPAVEMEPIRRGNWSLRSDREENPELPEIIETFYLECSVCRRKVTDIDQLKAWSGNWMELIRPYPYCHCGAKMHSQTEEQWYIDHGYMEPKQIDMWGDEEDGR